MNTRIIDMTGKRYASLTALSMSGKEASGDMKWIFRCDCGKEFEANGYYARSGKIINCPTCASERTRLSNLKHGLSESQEFKIWTGMLTRCYNKNSKSYATYGGNGIEVCDRWKKSFENFLSDMGKRPSKQHSIDRINNEGNYTPENCRWATQKEQANNKSNNVKITIDGVTKTLSDWSREFSVNVQASSFRRAQGLTGRKIFESRFKKIIFNGVSDTISGWSKRTGIKPTTIHMRIHKGWTIEKALTKGVS